MKNLFAALLVGLFAATAFAGAPPSGNAPVATEPPWEAPDETAAKPAKKVVDKKQEKNTKKATTSN